VGAGVGNRFEQKKVRLFPAAQPFFVILWQFKTFVFTDTCGVHNLHGIPGVIACVCGAIAVSNLDVKDGLPFSLSATHCCCSFALFKYLNLVTLFPVVPTPRVPV
jgi:hypothetical protein